ncbi:fungal-specific transcription factor domain-containing protein [Xylariomycetidae sp. FL2044]|nr:fungal-specific transcription factor domain-containing protein [Xylariomycetidae sp. FL2044]
MSTMQDAQTKGTLSTDPEYPPSISTDSLLSQCNGANPCSKCQALAVPCEYVIPQKPMPFGKNQYIKSLERRVAELETMLSKQGMSEMSRDHWNSPKADQSSSHADDSQSGAERGDSQMHTPDSDGDDQGVDWQDGPCDVVSVLRSLSLDANGQGYMGASSHVTMGKLFSFLGKYRRKSSCSIQHRHAASMLMQPLDHTESENDVKPIDFADVPTEVADRLLKGYWKHIGTRFPVLHSAWLQSVHQRRHSLTDVHEYVLLHLVYASGGRFLETAGEFGAFYPKRHYAAAVKHLDNILDYDDPRSVSALMLMAIYCLRNPVGPGAWTYSRLAMVIAIDLGLHRKTNAMKRRNIESEVRKRLFWATYAFDRQISIPLGRPFAISDRDIDVPLPLDINESTTAEELASIPDANLTRTSAPEISTSLSSFIQIVRIRRIESDIQQNVYRVDESSDVTDDMIDIFNDRLNQWKNMIPLDARGKRDQSHMDAIPYDGYDLYMVYYFKCKRLLLFPQISKTPVNPKYLKECATACAGVCGAYKRLHQAMAVGYSIMALQTVFMAGLTLVYCIWISPDEIFDITTSNGIHDCSIVLFVIAERVRSAKKYRNAFEVIRQRVIDQVSDDSCRKPRRTMSGLVAELGPSVHSFELNQPFEVDHDSFEQFSQIISEMSGSAYPGEMNPFTAPIHGNTADIDPELSPTALSHGPHGFPPDAHDLMSSNIDYPSPIPDFQHVERLDGGYGDGLSPWFSGNAGDASQPLDNGPHGGS